MTTYWRRMDATAMTGSLIRWPTHLDSYGGCGTSVYAVWPARQNEPMEVCSPGLIMRAILKEERVGCRNPWGIVFPDLDADDIEVAMESTDLLGVLLLGTTGASWALRDPAMPPDAPMHEAFTDFWTASVENLTDTGRTVIEAINASYGRQAVLLTVQDT